MLRYNKIMMAAKLSGRPDEPKLPSTYASKTPAAKAFAFRPPKPSVPTPSFKTTPILRAATKRSFRVARSFVRQQKSLPTEGDELYHILKTPAKWEDFCESTGAPLMWRGKKLGLDD